MNTNKKNNEDDMDMLVMQQPRLLNQMRLSLLTKQRKIMLWDEVTDDSIFEVIYGLNKLMTIDEKSGEKLPIEIHIKSNGGLVTSGLALISLMEEMKDNGYIIKTYNDSVAYSMGFLIFICGSERISYKYSRFMYHEMSAGTFGKYKEMTEQLEELSAFRNTLCDITKKYTTMSQALLDEYHMHKTDKYFSAEELKSHKGVDKII